MNIPLRETGLYSTRDDFYALFNQRKIKMIGDLLNNDSVDSLIKYSKKAGMEVEGFIELITYKYFGDFLPKESELDKVAYNIHTKGSELPYSDVDFLRMGFNRNDIWKLGIIFKNLYNLRVINTGTKLADTFDIIIEKNILTNKRDSTLVNKMSLYVECYEMVKLIEHDSAMLKERIK